MYLIDDSPTAENIVRLVFGEARQLGVAVAEVHCGRRQLLCDVPPGVGGSLRPFFRAISP